MIYIHPLKQKQLKAKLENRIIRTLIASILHNIINRCQHYLFT